MANGPVASARCMRQWIALSLAALVLAPIGWAQPITFYPPGDSLSFWGTCTPPGLIWHVLADSSGFDTIVLKPYGCELIHGVPHQVVARFDSAYFRIQDSLHENTYQLLWTSLGVGPPRIFELFADSLAWLDEGPFILAVVVWRGAMSVDSATVRGYSYQTGLSVDDVPGRLPHEVSLYQNYPNPFNPSTTTRYGLPSRSHVVLTVYNTLGQQVATLVEGEREAGFHEVVFDASGFASGV